jgi:hypothetical protein
MDERRIGVGTTFGPGSSGQRFRGWQFSFIFMMRPDLWLARALIWGLRPDLYDRVNQALDWEREQNRILQSRIDRLTSDRSGDESRTGPNGTDTSE